MELADLKVGQRVKAFHPATLGVIWHGDVTAVGRKYVTVLFSVNGKAYKMSPQYVTEIVSSDV